MRVSGLVVRSGLCCQFTLPRVSLPSPIDSPSLLFARFASLVIQWAKWLENNVDELWEQQFGRQAIGHKGLDFKPSSSEQYYSVWYFFCHKQPSFHNFTFSNQIGTRSHQIATPRHPFSHSADCSVHDRREVQA